MSFDQIQEFDKAITHQDQRSEWSIYTHTQFLKRASSVAFKKLF